MFVPKLFEQKNLPAVESFLIENGFAAVVSTVDGRPFATHTPLIFTEKKTLLGHFSRANPQGESLEGQEILCIFSGPHAYVSSSWYGQLNVSTWNYVAVHVYGRARVFDGDEALDFLAQLTKKYEKGQEKPLFVEQMPADYVRKEMRGVTCFEIEPTRIEGKWKLSQNRNDADFARVIAELEKIGAENERLVAEEMRKMRG